MCYVVLKPSQNKKDLAAEKKYSKNSAAGNCFGPYYFDPALCSAMTGTIVMYYPQCLLIYGGPKRKMKKTH